jgi:protein-tyrosine phosphatase
MRQLLPYHLWLGHAGDARDWRAILDAGIKALVQLALEEPAVQPPRELVYCRIPLVDGGGNPPGVLTLAITTVGRLLQGHTPTLVCCSAGMSRAPAVAAAAIALVERADPGACLQRVIAQHPRDVALPLWHEIFDLLPTLSGALPDPPQGR